MCACGVPRGRSSQQRQHCRLHPTHTPHRLPRGFHTLIGAQFCSALADNALLIVCMALLLERGLPAWWAPMLKFCFTIAYVVLAPFVGALADAVPKGRLMMVMNGVKVMGVLALLTGLNPLLPGGAAPPPLPGE